MRRRSIVVVQCHLILRFTLTTGCNQWKCSTFTHITSVSHKFNEHIAKIRTRYKTRSRRQAGGRVPTSLRRPLVHERTHARIHTRTHRRTDKLKPNNALAGKGIKTTKYKLRFSIPAFSRRSFSLLHQTTAQSAQMRLNTIDQKLRDSLSLCLIRTTDI